MCVLTVFLCVVVVCVLAVCVWCLCVLTVCVCVCVSAGLSPWTGGDFPCCFAVHDLRGPKERLQQVQEHALRSPAGKHTHTHTHTYINTRTHTHKYTDTHTHIHTRAHTHTTLNCNLVSIFVPDSMGVHRHGSHLQVLCRGNHVPLPGGAREAARPTQYLQWPERLYL